MVFTRAFKGNRWHVGNRIKVRGTSRKGTVREVIKDLNKVEWERNRPLFIVVEMDDGVTMIGHPGQFKGSNK